MHMRTLMALLGAATMSLGCEEQSTKLTVGIAPDQGNCPLTLDTLDDTEWLFLKANPDKTETADIKTRLKFTTKDGKLVAKYNVGSVSEFYDYNCNKVGEELICKEEPKVKDWCQALVSGGLEACTYEAVKGIDPNVTQEQFDKGKKDSDEIIAKYKDGEMWKKFKFQNNNLGNKLQGLLYIKIDSRKCRLRITDNYVTIYNAKRVEDSNPAGTNAFVKNEEGELLWEGCKSQDLITLAAAEYPKNPTEVGHEGRHEVGKEVHYWLLSEKTTVPEEGCTYSADVWRNGRSKQKGYTPEVVDVRKGKELRWHMAETFTSPSAPGQTEVTAFIASKECAGKKEQLDVACNAVLIK